MIGICSSVPQVVDSGEAPTGLYRRLAGVLEAIRAMRSAESTPSDIRVTTTADLRDLAKALRSIRFPTSKGIQIRVPDINTGGTRYMHVPVYHDGGRVVPAEAFSHAPRFHSGGYVKPGEVPAILQAGELVIPKSVAASRSSKAGGIVVNLHYNPTNDFRGADASTVARLEQAQKNMAINFRDFVQASVRDPRRR